MSFRELKQFTQIIRALGYEEPIGIDSFDSPNFGLMANLLKWLATLYNPDLYIVPDITTEQGRVELVKNITQQMAITSGIRINPRRLYASDRFAVRELLKLAAPMYKGLISTFSSNVTKSVSVTSPPSTEKISRMSAKIPKTVLELHDQLDKELSIRDDRNRILSTMPPLDQLEKDVVASVDAAAARLDVLNKELDTLNSSSDVLKSKISHRKHELERQSKRFLSVQTVRPAFMDDYEELEQDLSTLFQEYSQFYRNVDYYEHELQKISEVQEQTQKDIERQFKNMKKHESRKIMDQLTNPAKINNFDTMINSMQSTEDIDALVDNDDLF